MMTVGELVAYLRLDDGQFNRGLDQAHSRIGRVGGAIGTAVKRGAVVAGAAITGLIGTTLVKGFQRLSSIENATAKLRGLGHSAAEVQLIMDNALASVKGTAFGLDEAATIAATTVAAGVKPGQDLEKTLRLVADAATIGGGSLAEMGAIFNKVAASNKIQGDVIAQLNDAGIPIVQLLGKTLGKTSAEVVALASAGKIHFPEFQKAMEKSLGGAALASGGTTIGSWKNMMAALSRLGASALSGIFPSFKVAFAKVTAYLDQVAAKYGDKFKAWGEKVSAAFKTGGFTGMFKAMLPAGVGDTLITTFNVIKDTTVAIVKVIGTIAGVFSKLPGALQKFAIAAGVLALALGKFGLLGSAKGLFGGLLGKVGGGAATEVPLTTAVGLNTAATEANTLALMGKGGLPGGGKTPLPLGAPGGTKPGGGGWSSLLGGIGKVLGAGAIASAAGDLLKGTDADYKVAMDKMAAAAGKGKQIGASLATSLRASGDKAGAGLAAGLARGVGPALQSIQKVRNSAGRNIHMGHLDATQMLNEIARVSRALGGISGAARTASNAVANALAAKSGVGPSSYRGHFMAAGGDFMVNRPTVFVAGEAGPERATFTPKGKEPPGTSGGTVINLAVNVANVHGTDRAAATKLANMAGEIFMQQVRFA